MSKTVSKFALVQAIFISLVALSPALVAENNAPKAGETLKWQVVSSGGTTNGTSPSYKLSSTVGQTAAGPGSSASYKINHGFQQNFSTPCFCGDADGNTIITISDAVYLINYIFAGGAAPDPICNGDADGNSIITISDAVYLINYIFAGGPAPHCP